MSSDSDSDFGKEASKTPKRRITDCLFDSDDEVLESPGREELRKLLLSDYEDVGSVTIDTPKLKNRNVRLRGAGRPQKGGDDYKDYGRSEMEQFLRLVSDKPFLWHTKDSDFHRKKEKGMPAWAEIERTCNTFMGKGRTPGKTAAALFKKMATTYKSHLTRIQKAPSGSAVTPKKDLFCYAELMSFMDEDITHRAPTWFVEKTLKYYFQLQFYSSFIVGAGPDVDVLPTETSSSKKKNDQKKEHRKSKSGYSREEAMEDAQFLMKNFMKQDDDDVKCGSRVCQAFEKSVDGISHSDASLMEYQVLKFIENLKAKENQNADSFRPTTQFAPPSYNSQPMSYYSVPHPQHYNTYPQFPQYHQDPPFPYPNIPSSSQCNASSSSSSQNSDLHDLSHFSYSRDSNSLYQLKKE